MKKKTAGKLAAAVAIALALHVNSVQALNVSTDLNNYTSSVKPYTVSETTTVPTNHNIDIYNWSSFNVGEHETVNFLFSQNGQTAVSYLEPGVNPSAIEGMITCTGQKNGNVFLFNPNGLIMTKNASVCNIDTFFVSTNQFDGISGNKILFSEPDVTNRLTVQNIYFHNTNNAHFVAPGIEFNPGLYLAGKFSPITNIVGKHISVNDTLSIKALGGGEYDISTHLFSNEQEVTSPALSSEIININTYSNIISAKNIDIESKANYDGYTNIQISGNFEANSALTEENGSIYIMASNSSEAENSGSHMALNGSLVSADVNIDVQNVVLNGEIDASGNNGGVITINSKSFDHYGNIIALGNNGKGGSVDIQATDYTASTEALIDVSGKTDGGDIKIIADNQIETSGNYRTISNEGNGGNIKISAPILKQLSLNIDASGHTEGGKILLGGEFKGGMYLEEDIIPNSVLNIFDEGCLIKANCTGNNGNGGTIIVWSDHTMDAFGTIEAKGGSISGKGGFVEISGQEAFNFDANVDTNGGTLMLDPKDIIIDDSQSGSINIANYTFGSFPESPLTLSVNDLAPLLALQDVILQANNDITVVENITGGTHDLTLQAGRSIDFQADVTLNSGDLNIIANETAEAGVFNDYRDAGAAQVIMGTGTAIDVGTGNVTIQLKAGDDKTHFESGDIALNSITASRILVLNEGLTAGSDVILNTGGVLTASGTDNPLVLSTANGTFTNNSGGNSLSAVNDRWLVYSDHPENTTLNQILPDSEIYDATYSSHLPETVDSGNNLLFREGENEDPPPPPPPVSSDGGSNAAAIAIPLGVAGLGILSLAAMPGPLATTPPVYRMMSTMRAIPTYMTRTPNYITGAAAPPPYVIKQDEESKEKK